MKCAANGPSTNRKGYTAESAALFLATTAHLEAAALFHPRAEERANVNTDAEGEVIEVQRNAAAVVDFQIEKGTRLKLSK